MMIGPHVGGLVLHVPDIQPTALLHCRQVVARPAFPGDDRALGRADRLERVGGVVPAGDADDDRHCGLLSIFSTIFDLEMSSP
jgi:hypothetical protein